MHNSGRGHGTVLVRTAYVSYVSLSRNVRRGVIVLESMEILNVVVEFHFER